MTREDAAATMTVQMDSDLNELTELATVLWDEREVMNLVLFRLTVERLVVSSGHNRWLADANRELEIALDHLHRVEVLRAMESAAVAELLALPADATLATLADAAPEPWSTMLRSHREALLALAAEIAEAVEENRRLLDAGARMLRDTLLSITDAAGRYDSRGQAASATQRLSRLDEQA
jgi:hypothetical protein